MIFISSFWHRGSGFTGELLCLVVGAFEDVSEDLKRTIKAIAKSRETGQPAVSEARAGWILGQYKRLLSWLFVRSQASFCWPGWWAIWHLFYFKKLILQSTYYSYILHSQYRLIYYDIRTIDIALKNKIYWPYTALFSSSSLTFV